MNNDIGKLFVGTHPPLKAQVQASKGATVLASDLNMPFDAVRCLIQRLLHYAEQYGLGEDKTIILESLGERCAEIYQVHFDIVAKKNAIKRLDDQEMSNEMNFCNWLFDIHPDLCEWMYPSHIYPWDDPVDEASS